jgi:nicotinate-nucleotide pyrophosphorylase (carboxylating)
MGLNAEPDQNVRATGHPSLSEAPRPVDLGCPDVDLFGWSSGPRESHPASDIYPTIRGSKSDARPRTCDYLEQDLKSPAEREDLSALVARALAEDVGGGDVTSQAVVPEGARARARVVQKQPGVVFGLAAVAETMRQCGVEDVDDLVVEGRWREEVPAEVVLLSGPAAGLLAAERTALNFLGHLSGVATLTARFAEAVEGTGAAILDTRKTTPGLRGLEKAAVAAAGGRNHRMGLHDAILIKENHIALAGSPAKAVHAARTRYPDLPVEVECRNLDEVAYALGTGADRLLLDNMDAGTLRKAVELRDTHDGGVPALEASGGVSLETVRAIAETGVDFISVGALTHSAPTLDFSLLLEPA